MAKTLFIAASIVLDYCLNFAWCGSTDIVQLVGSDFIPCYHQSLGQGRPESNWLFSLGQRKYRKVECCAFFIGTLKSLCLKFELTLKKMLREYRSHRFLRKEISKWFSKYFQNWTTSVPVINFFPNFYIVELRRQKNENGSTVLRFLLQN